MTMLRQFVKYVLKKSESTVVQDDYLGEISKDRDGNWTGSKHFGPTNSQIEFAFRTDDPPTPEHIAFFRSVESQFPELWSGLRRTLFSDLDDLSDGTTMTEFFDSLKVESIWFSDVAVLPYHWEISCTTDLDVHLIGIVMVGLTNRGFRMDG